MLNQNLEFNYRSIRSFTCYSCELSDNTIEKEISFHINIGPATERKGDAFPVFEVPNGKMVWLSDWSFNSGGPLNPALSIGGSLGRITPESMYVYVLNCSVSAGEMRIFSPSRPIRYIPNEWLAVCFHHMGAPIDLAVRATFRFIEVPCDGETFKTDFFTWGASGENDTFPGPR